MSTPKTYIHTVPNSRYIASDGSEHIFSGGQLTTSDLKIQADLDKQIASGVSMLRVAGASAAVKAQATKEDLMQQMKDKVAEAAAAAEAAKNAELSGAGR